ncbi:hypothetical protein PPERSA_09393 [Pseudocohnilembus persalinus]|uniref:Uncharacterized protein n=1 Tax=Pseudocohnilembus persalinus TaxID=266149 RepID=A0A0V0QKZ4_PSEPJ|nr:hypothetical protein PPERSA_09393 [Pseudocohnilembus persalinus]|eukprot:KRX02975.1 hypothetical protein PPERSA_09393 [Pseudocohnilembus persalinus]
MKEKICELQKKEPEKIIQKEIVIEKQTDECPGHIEKIIYYQQFIDELKMKLITAEKELEQLQDKYDDILEKIENVKNKENFEKIYRKWQYSLVRTEEIDDLERIIKEKQFKIDLISKDLQQQEKENKEMKFEQEKLHQQIKSLKSELEIFKGKGKFTSSFQDIQYKNFRNIGEEIAILKSTIDGNIKNLQFIITIQILLSSKINFTQIQASIRQDFKFRSIIVKILKNQQLIARVITKNRVKP